MIHISDKTWEVYDVTGEMISTNTDYLTEETDIDLMNKYIEQNNFDDYYNE